MTPVDRLGISAVIRPESIPAIVELQRIRANAVASARQRWLGKTHPREARRLDRPRFQADTAIVLPFVLSVVVLSVALANLSVVLFTLSVVLATLSVVLIILSVALAAFGVTLVIFGIPARDFDGLIAADSEFEDAKLELRGQVKESERCQLLLPYYKSVSLLYTSWPTLIPLCPYARRRP